MTPRGNPPRCWRRTSPTRCWAWSLAADTPTATARPLACSEIGAASLRPSRPSMPSVAPQPDRSAFAYARRALPLALAALLLALLLLGARSVAPPAAVAQGGCPALPVGLSP